jgi:hypothetical protein
MSINDAFNNGLITGLSLRLNVIGDGDGDGGGDVTFEFVSLETVKIIRELEAIIFSHDNFNIETVVFGGVLDVGQIN